MAIISKEDDDYGSAAYYGSAPLIVVLVLPLVIGVIILLKCILNHCCVRKTTTKEEMYGVEGRMTILPNVESSFIALSPSNQQPQPQQIHQSLSLTVSSSSATSQQKRQRHLPEQGLSGSSSPIIETRYNPIQAQLSLKSSYMNTQQQQKQLLQKQTSNNSNQKNQNGSTVVDSGGGTAAASTSPHTVIIPNLSPKITSTVIPSLSGEPSDSYETVDLTDSSLRSTLHRQLPDLPQIPLSNLQMHNPPRRSSSILSHDGTSELYATVGDCASNLPRQSSSESSNYYNVSTRKSVPVVPSSSSSSHHRTTKSQQHSAERTNISSGMSKNNSSKLNSKNEPTPSSDSETYSGIHPVHHPYAKLKRNVVEHPYARVGRTGGNNEEEEEEVGVDEETDTDNYDTPHPYAQTRHPNSRITHSTASKTNSSSTSGPSNPGHSSSTNHPNNNTVNIDGNSSSSSSNHPSSSTNSANNNNNSNSNDNSDMNRQPIPPTRDRTGRHWRRSSHPQAVQNNDNQQQFSGDSQDSRGYTSISVREPLSNIIANRSQVANIRNCDSHYATVSDDSEDNYAAIEDGNYMRIPGEDGDGRHWIGGPPIHVASPIPERREANSPLPPPPPLMSPPEVNGTPLHYVPSESQPESHASNVGNPNPPLYAQVTKKNKKGKAPIMPTTTTTSKTTPSSSSSQSNNNNNSSNNSNNHNSSNSNNTITNIPPNNNLNDFKLSSPSSNTNPTTSVVASSSSSSNRNRHTISDNTSIISNTSAAALLSPIDSIGPSSEPRRWSKADISYSEFEVVREPLYNSSLPKKSTERHAASSSPSVKEHSSSINDSHSISSNNNNNNHNSKPLLPKNQSSKKLNQHHHHHHHQAEELLDEDNYNVIPEPSKISRSSRDGSSSSSSGQKKSHRTMTSTPPSTTKAPPIPPHMNSSDNYQEIEDLSEFHISNAYQEIDRKEPSDYYQEIGVVKNSLRENLQDQAANKSSSNRNSGNFNDYQLKSNNLTTATPSPPSPPTNNLYQEIDKKPGRLLTNSRNLELQVDDDDEEEEDEDDPTNQFYERVKLKPNKPSSSKQQQPLKYTSTPSPSHSQASMTSLDRKHGYEKLRKKGPTTVVVIASDDDDDEDDNKNEDSMYERVKYPPYERLKESRDDLQDLPLDDDDEDDGQNGKNLYEDIRYSRVVKPKGKKNLMPASPTSSSAPTTTTVKDKIDHHEDIQAKDETNDMIDGGETNLDQLYARVDKTKKKKHNIPTTTTPSAHDEAKMTTDVAIKFVSSSGNTTNLQSNDESIVMRDEIQACMILRSDDNNSIEYI